MIDVNVRLKGLKFHFVAFKGDIHFVTCMLRNKYANKRIKHLIECLIRSKYSYVN